MSRTILMGDPKYFSVIGGANPHTRNLFGMKRKVDPERARENWHALAKALIAKNVEVCVIDPHKGLSGLVYPANAGFLYPLAYPKNPLSSSDKIFYLSNLISTRAAEREVYEKFLTRMGYRTIRIGAPFEGEADFFPSKDAMLFTHGAITRQRFVPRLGFPPWKRIYGFRSSAGAFTELGRACVYEPQIIPLELALEAHYHGDTVLCSFGAEREFLLAYMRGLAPASQTLLRKRFGARLIELSDHDAARYAANSFEAEDGGKRYLFMPDGLSDKLLNEIRVRDAEPILTDVGEFLKKGGGSVKCMILDLGPTAEQPQDRISAEFRESRRYQNLY